MKYLEVRKNLRAIFVLYFRDHMMQTLKIDVFIDLFYNLLYKRLLGSWGLQITQNKTSLPNVLGHGRQPGLARSNSWSSYLYLIPIFIVCYAKPCRIVPSHKMLRTSIRISLVMWFTRQTYIHYCVSSGIIAHQIFISNRPRNLQLINNNNTNYLGLNKKRV